MITPLTESALQGHKNAICTFIVPPTGLDEYLYYIYFPILYVAFSRLLV